MKMVLWHCVHMGRICGGFDKHGHNYAKHYSLAWSIVGLYVDNAYLGKNEMAKVNHY